MGITSSWSDKLQHKFPKQTEDKKKEPVFDTRVLSKEDSWEFEKALRERLKNLRSDCLIAIGKD
jgi:hypothetical protein